MILQRSGLLLTALAVLFLTGCGSSSGGGEAAKPIDPNTPPKEITWGDLKCQQAKTCENAVLNLSIEELNDFFLQDLSLDQTNHSLSDEEKIFRCSAHLGRKWDQLFSRFETTQTQNLADFLFEVFDPIRCEINADLGQRLENYFKNSKEYLNEIN